MGAKEGRPLYKEAPDRNDPEEKYYRLVDSADRALKYEEWVKAENYLLRAVKSDPANSGNTLLFSNLGVARMQQGKFPEALQSLDLALVRASKSITILTLHARVLFAMGREREGLQDLDDILQTDSLNEWALQTRALLKLKSSGNPGADFQTLLRHYPENPWGWYGFGIHWTQEGDNLKAIQNLGRAWGLEHNPEIAFQLAMQMLEEGQLEDAGTLLRTALKEHPREGNLYVAMAAMHKKSYQNDEAAADLKLAHQYGADPRLINALQKMERVK